MPGHLFTDYFLTDGIKATPEWVASADAADALRDDVRPWVRGRRAVSVSRRALLRWRLE